MGLQRLILGVLATAAVLTASLAASGCGSDRDPNQRLTADEGAALLKDIRSDRSRMQSLTPAEREYLARTLAK